MKKKLRVLFSLTMILTLVLSMSTGAFAAAGPSTVKATLNPTIKFKLNGMDWAPKDANGNYVKALVYNGQVYLPVAALSKDIAKLPYDFDAKAGIVWIGGKTEILKVDSKSVYEDYYGTMVTTDAVKLTTAGDSYKWGIANSGVATMQVFGASMKGNGKFAHFRTSFFVDATAKQAVTFEIKKEDRNGEVIKEVVVEPGQTVADVDVDVTGVKKVYIAADIKSGHGEISKIVLGEPMFYNGSLPGESPEVK